MARETAGDRMERIAARALELGYVPDGVTLREEVRTFSGFSPRLLVAGGRSRFALPGSGERITVGPRTICVFRRDPTAKETFYRAIASTVSANTVREYQGDGIADMTCIDTRDVNAAIATIEDRAITHNASLGRLVV